MGNSTPCKIVTSKNFNLKLCTRDYVGEVTHHAILVLSGTVGAFPYIGELLPTIILNSRLGSSANPFLHRPFPFLPDWLHGLSDLAQRLYGCVRLSRPLVGFWTHFKSPHFHSFHSFTLWLLLTVLSCPFLFFLGMLPFIPKHPVISRIIQSVCQADFGVLLCFVKSHKRHKSSRRRPKTLHEKASGHGKTNISPASQYTRIR